MIEGARVKPHAIRTQLPRALDGEVQQVPAEALAVELGEKTEVGDLDRAVVAPPKLDVPGWSSVVVEDPEGEAGLGQVIPDLLLAPTQAVEPPIRAPNLRVQVSKEGCRARVDPVDPG